MINFIYGLPGTGKTTEIVKRIKADVEAGKQVMLIVPEQQTVEVERRMLLDMPASAQLSFEVLNFTRLANKLFRIYGGLSYNYITNGMKHLFMKRALIALSSGKEADGEVSHSLKEFGARAQGDSSLPALMLGQINEFKLNNVSNEKLDDVSRKDTVSDRLRDKLSDLSEIYRLYSHMIAKSYSDGADDLQKLYSILNENNYFKNVCVYIDSFSSYTAHEYKIIECIFDQAQSCTISIPYHERLSGAIHLVSVQKTDTKLNKLADGRKINRIMLDKPYRASDPSLFRLWNSLWDFSLKSDGLDFSDGSIKILECGDMYSEAEAAANTVLSFMQAGYRCNEIAVIAGDMNAYKGIIDSAFEKAEIPFFMSEKADMNAKPLVSLFSSAFAIKQKKWRADDVIAYLKTGLTGIPTEKIDLFEIYVSTWKIKGNRFLDDVWTMNPDGYTDRVSERGESIRKIANEVKDELKSTLLPFFAELEAAKSVKELCAVTYEFFKSQEFSKKLGERAEAAYKSGDRKSAFEYAGTHKAFIQVLSDVSAALGDEAMTVEEFSSSLKLVFGNTDIGTIPTAADQVVLGSASSLRASGIKCAVLIGVCDGVFPAHVSDSGFFTDSEKKELSNYDIELSTTLAQSSAEELLYAYRAVTLPSEKLVMTYYTKMGITAYKPSLIISRACFLLNIPLKKIPRYENDELGRLMSRKLSLEAHNSISDEKTRTALAAVLKKNESCHEVLEKIKVPISTQECKLTEKTANSLFGNELTLTQSKIDKYVKCHFNYFCNYVLKLRDTTPITFNFANTGTFVHYLLEMFIKYTISDGTVNRNIQPPEIENLVESYTKSYIDSIFGVVEPTPRQLHLFTRLKNLAIIVATSLYNELLHGKFVPKYLEMKFGKSHNSTLPPFELPLRDGTKVLFEGAVDRLDVYKDGDTVYLKIIDYKTGAKTFDIAEIEQGLNIQLLLYLFAICNTTSEEFKKSLGCNGGDSIKPACALYISTNIPTLKIEYGTLTEDVLKKAMKNIPHAGLVSSDENIVNALSDDLQASPLPGVKLTNDGIQNPKGVSEEGFEVIEENINRVLGGIAAEIKSGNAAINPIKVGQNFTCQYCQMKQFCRVDLSNLIQDENDYSEKENDCEAD